MKRYFILLFLSVLTFSGMSQNLPVYSQYFFDPFLYNVGYAGVNGYTELNINYRQQWAGIEDAPVTSTFNLQIPTKGNVSYAISAYTEKAVLLRNSVAFGTFGYRVPFSDEHFLNLGLSAGVGLSSIDVEGLDTNDPAYTGAYPSSYYLDGQFGAYYVFKNLNVGISLPKLFGSTAISDEFIQEVNLAPLDNIIYTLSYKFDLPRGMFAFTPYILYRESGNNQNQIEGSGIVSYKEIVYLGGSYRVDYGPSLFLGLKIKENFNLGYAYEMATEQTTSIGQGTHEFQLKIKLGKNKRVKEKTKRVLPVEEIEPEVVEEPIQLEKEEHKVPIIVPVVVIKDTVNNAIDVVHKVEETVPEINKEPIIEEKVVEVPVEPIKTDDKDIVSLQSGIYIVIGVFNSRENALNYSKKIIIDGFENDIGQHKNGSYYVYVQSSSDIDEARIIRNKLINKGGNNIKKAWVLEIE